MLDAEGHAAGELLAAYLEVVERGLRGLIAGLDIVDGAAEQVPLHGYYLVKRLVVEDALQLTAGLGQLGLALFLSEEARKLGLERPHAGGFVLLRVQLLLALERLQAGDEVDVVGGVLVELRMGVVAHHRALPFADAVEAVDEDEGVGEALTGEVVLDERHLVGAAQGGGVQDEHDGVGLGEIVHRDLRARGMLVEAR